MLDMILRRLLPSFALFLAGCAGTTEGYPSLARRAVENQDFAAPAPDVKPDAPDAQLQAEVDRLLGQALAGGEAFDKAYAAAQKSARAAAKSAISSEAWVSAQVSVSGLESSRNDSVSALAALDTLYADRMSAIADGKVGGGADIIDSARARALSVVDSQNDRIDALKADLSQPAD